MIVFDSLFLIYFYDITKLQSFYQELLSYIIIDNIVFLIVCFLEKMKESKEYAKGGNLHTHAISQKPR